VIVEEGVHYSGKYHKGIIRADDVERILTNSLESVLDNYLGKSLKKLNHHSDVLIEEEKLEKHNKVFPKEGEVLRPYVFYFNKLFMSVDLVADAGGNLAQMSSQIKMKEEDSLEVLNPWNKDVQLLERMLDSQD